MKRLPECVMPLAAGMLCCLLCGTTVRGAEPDMTPFDSLCAVTPTDVMGLQNLLTHAYTLFSRKVTVNAIDYFSYAQARLQQDGELVAVKPEDPENKKLFQELSMIVHTAVLQMAARYNEQVLTELADEHQRTLSRLNQVHEEILTIEKSNASRLKADLDREKQKAQELRDKAQQKFAELQSALIQVSEDARGTIISMSDILFEVGKANLTPDLKTSLAKIAGILLVFKNSHVIVEGHTDNVGTEDFNQTLSEARAENVREFLIEQGVSPSRLRSIGYGFHRPIASNETAEGRQKNRRVDLVVQEQKGSDEP